MKLLLALLATALLVPLAVAPARAQADGDATRLLEDRAGDVKFSVGGTDQDPQGHWLETDLKALDVMEAPDKVTLRLTVASLQTSQSVPFAETVDYDVGFRHLDKVYRAHITRNMQSTSASAFGYLQAYNPARQRYEQVGAFQDVPQDVDAGTLTFTVDRDLLADREGDTPHPEVPFTDWHADATGSELFGARVGGFCPIDQLACMDGPIPFAHDAMPDQGNGTLPLVFRYGVSQLGHARLSSPTPTRASNGEATTIVYQVTAENRASRNETFALTASSVPSAWLVRLPAARVTIPANGTVLLPVLLSVPFAHQHGTYQKFLLELTSMADPGSVGRIQLGIRYTNPPQPAGHHNVLWLHATAQAEHAPNAALDQALYGSAGLYMNALEDDPLDAHTDMPGYSCRGSFISTSGPKDQACWFVDLRPQLELGLDFDLARVGSLSLPIKTNLPLLNAQLSGAMYYVAPSDDFGSNGFAVATLRGADPANLDARSTTILKADIVPTQEGDYVPYRKGGALFLELFLTYTGQSVLSANLGVDAPSIAAGGILADLPLNEYHDAVAAIFASNSTLQLLANGAQDRPVNPGKAVVFNLTLENHGAAGVFNLELTGTHLPWARLVTPSAQIRLGAGQSVPIQVAVQVPKDADKGDTADLVLSATSASDLNVRSLARLFATVDTAHQYPDEAGLLGAPGKTKGTPGAAEGLLAVGLLSLALVARRRGPRAATTTAY